MPCPYVSAVVGVQLSGTWNRRGTSSIRIGVAPTSFTGTMPAKSAYIQARVEPGLKEEATRVFEQLGLSSSEAITLFLRQVVMHHGLPFELRIPNAETKAAIREAFEERNELQRYETVEELFEDLGI